MSILLHDSEEDLYEGREQMFLGDCCGVLLRQRGPDDLHIVYYFLTEDDGNWFINSNSGPSSFWLPEQIWVLRQARRWMKKHAAVDGAYGYRFRRAPQQEAVGCH